MIAINFILAAAIIQSSAVTNGNFMSACTIRALHKAPAELLVLKALTKAEKRCSCLSANLDQDAKETYVTMHLLSLLPEDETEEEQASEILKSVGGQEAFLTRMVLMGSKSELIGNTCDRENTP